MTEELPPPNPSLVGYDEYEREPFRPSIGAVTFWLASFATGVIAGLLVVASVR